MVDGPKASCVSPSEVLSRNLSQMRKDGCVIKPIERLSSMARYSAQCEVAGSRPDSLGGTFLISIEPTTGETIKIMMDGPFRSTTMLTFKGPCKEEVK
jgi:hypothetical protein